MTSFPRMRRAFRLSSIGQIRHRRQALKVITNNRSSNDNKMFSEQGTCGSSVSPVEQITHPPRFIHLRLLLFRPMFTQLCSEERAGATRPPDSMSPRPEKNEIYSSMSVNCAAACVKAAAELVSHVFETYKTSLTDAWWYNGFCQFPPAALAKAQTYRNRYIHRRLRLDNVILVPLNPATSRLAHRGRKLAQMRGCPYEHVCV